MDDLIYLKTGDQVPADAKVLEGSLEVNESLLTGEADNLSKNEGDELFSGSFVTSGEACCQVVHVGRTIMLHRSQARRKSLRGIIQSLEIL